MSKQDELAERRDYKQWAEAQSDTFLAAYIQSLVTIPPLLGLHEQDNAALNEASKRLYHAADLTEKRERNGW